MLILTHPVLGRSTPVPGSNPGFPVPLDFEPIAKGQTIIAKLIPQGSHLFPLSLIKLGSTGYKIDFTI